MRDGGQPEPPTIVVLTAAGIDAESAPLRQLLAGIEEESVPYEVLTADPAGASELATAAAERSSLEVGIGVASDGSLAVTHRTLPDEAPLAVAPAPVADEVARRLGRAAARVVVGLPLDG